MDGIPSSASSRSSGGRRRLDFEDASDVPITKRSVKRMSNSVDLSTGKQGGAREHTAHIRRRSESQPMGTSSRRKRNIKKMLGVPPDQQPEPETPAVHGRLLVEKNVLHVGKKHDDHEEYAMTSSSQNLTQYRLKATKASRNLLTAGLKMFGISPRATGIYEDVEDLNCICCGINPNDIVNNYLHWTFRSSFVAVFFSVALAFFILTMVFAFVYMAAAIRKPQCVHVNGEQYGNGTKFFQDLGDAYALSWTTFTTVGYGLVFPSVSSIHAGQRDCIAISILSTVESFVGILFGGFCGAVLFGKVVRIRSHAQVKFSEAMVIRYGSGVMAESSEIPEEGSQESEPQESGSEHQEGDEENPNLSHQLPCPVLEFRIVNSLHGTTGGEIIDATLNIVASIDERQASPAIRRAARRGFGRKKFRRRRRLPQRPPTILEEIEDPVEPLKPHESFRTIAEAIRQHARRHHHQAFEEDPTGKIVPRRIFSKLEVEAPENPFFKRQWIVRHILDARSPLLTEEARKIVRLNDGYWPKELNDHESVHASIQFDQILVSLSGISNVDANACYIQKIYEYEDISVGYSFVNILYRKEDNGHLLVDPHKINDVVEQYGGGGEPLVVIQKRRMTDMLVL